MGSTGHGIYNKGGAGDNGSNNFGLEGVSTYKGDVPEGSGLKKPGAGKITLKSKADDGNNIIFQFSLNRAGTEMTIVGYKDGIPKIRSTVEVDAGRPSLDKVILSGNSKQKQQATRMKELFAQSGKIKESQLGNIAQELLNKKRNRGE